MLRALEINELARGPDHPEVAISLNNLAMLLQETNRLPEAEPHLRRALAIDERAYGPDHPRVAADLNNLALLLKRTKPVGEAEPLYRRSLAIHERSYGPDHPRLAGDLNNLAKLLQDTDRLAEAEPPMRRGVEILWQFTMDNGREHPRLRVAMNNYESLLLQMGSARDEVLTEAEQNRQPVWFFVWYVSSAGLNYSAGRADVLLRTAIHNSPTDSASSPALPGSGTLAASIPFPTPGLTRMLYWLAAEKLGST